jgi:hypothetical protein
MVETVVKDTGAETLVNEMMREVGKISFKELARNSIAAKNLSAFIADMAEQLPKLVLPNVSLLMSHFEGEVRRCCSLAPQQIHAYYFRGPLIIIDNITHTDS